MRLIGVRGEQLVGAVASLGLWDDDEAWRDAEYTVDAVASKFGAGAVRPAALLQRADSGAGSGTGTTEPTRVAIAGAPVSMRRYLDQVSESGERAGIPRDRRPPSSSRRPSPSGPRAAPSPRCAPGSKRRSTHYFSATHRDFLVSATPGAGKTTFALRLAAELLQHARHRPDHRGRADRAPEDAVGGCGASRRHPARPAVQQPARARIAAVPRRGRDLRAGRRARHRCTAR